MRPARIALLLIALTAAATLLLVAHVAGADNNTPATADPLDQYNHVTGWLNPTPASVTW